MNEMKIFKNSEFGEVRVVEINNQPWFIGKDVAEILGYAEPRSVVSKKVDIEDKGVSKIATPSGTQEMTVINESGLYSLILSSKLPNAKKFKRWVTSEVLPQIRKTGGYIPTNENMSDAEIMARALMVAQKTIESKDQLIEDMIPKALFADAVSASHTTILIGELAKILKQNGVDTGQKRLFGWLRDNGFLIKRNGSEYNMPTQKSMDLGLFEIKEGSRIHSDGHVSVTKTTKVTGKGQIYFINKLKPTEKLALAED